MGPFLAAVAAFALTTGGFWLALAAFLVFAAVMGGLMLGVSVLVGMSQGGLLRRMRASSGRIQRVASVLLIAVGAGLIYFTLDAGRFQSIFFPS
ncbi:MAG: hypothetical protein IIC30_04380 [Chloroflexi bacterium]|nr:hypothetical protein [Chloroflexota bacterium]